jgi:plastocyanin
MTNIARSLVVLGLVAAGAPATARTATDGRVGSGGEATGRDKVVVVEIKSLRFAKSTVTVEAGTTIAWRNRDPLSHTVTSDSSGFDSGEIRPDAGWNHTFTVPGTFSYHCGPHPNMQATVVVRPKTESRRRS